MVSKSSKEDIILPDVPAHRKSQIGLLNREYHQRARALTGYDQMKMIIRNKILDSIEACGKAVFMEVFDFGYIQSVSNDISEAQIVRQWNIMRDYCITGGERLKSQTLDQKYPPDEL